MLLKELNSDFKWTPLITAKNRERQEKSNLSNLFGGPSGLRTRVTDVRGRCPRPLDDGTFSKKSICNDQLAIYN